MKPHLRQCWVIPPKEDAAFVAAMEDVLDVYHQPYDPKKPVICQDEKPIQLIREIRVPIKAKPGRPTRSDFEYERNGTAVHFMFCEPMNAWRKVNIRKRRTDIDWALEIEALLERDYPQAEVVILICDNLNTHKIASLYKAFKPEKARRLARRLQIHYTPKHGSWLNIAEIELSVLTKQCLDRRIPDMKTLRHQVKAWQQDRNVKHKTVNWRFSTADARIKLSRLYPQFEPE